MNLERGVVPTVLLVGVAPSRTSDPRRPLSGTSGRFLAETILGLEHAAFLRRFSRVNLLDQYPGHSGPLRASERLDAIERARLLVLDPDWTLIVLLGADAWRATSACDGTPVTHAWLAEYQTTDGTTSLLTVPHPSGLSRWWNDPRHRLAARTILAEFVDRPLRREATP